MAFSKVAYRRLLCKVKSNGMGTDRKKATNRVLGKIKCFSFPSYKQFTAWEMSIGGPGPVNHHFAYVQNMKTLRNSFNINPEVCPCRRNVTFDSMSAWQLSSRSAGWNNAKQLECTLLCSSPAKTFHVQLQDIDYSTNKGIKSCSTHRPSLPFQN